MYDPKLEKFYKNLEELLRYEDVSELNKIIGERKKNWRGDREMIDYVILSTCKKYELSENILRYGKQRRDGKRWFALMTVCTIMSQLIGMTYKDIGKELEKSFGCINNYMKVSNRIVIDAVNNVTLTAEEKDFYYTLKELYEQARQYRKIT